MIRFVGRAVRVAWYLFMAAVVLIGLPWVAIHFVGWPLPRHLPDGATFRDWIDHPFVASRFWKAVTVVGWVLWASLVYVIVVEVSRQIGRARMPRIRLATPLQGIAAGMVGAAVTALSSGAASAAGAAPPVAVATATVPDLDIDPVTVAPAEVSYVVERGDWLSGIADRFLGDPDAYPRLQALNPKLEARDARFPNHIEPGWRIRLPADAHDRGIRLHAAGHLLHPTPAPPKPTPVTPPVEPATTKPAPPATAGSTPTGTPSATAPVTQPNRGAPGDVIVDSAVAKEDGHPDVLVGTSHGAMAGAGLLASLLFALLTAERRRQRSFFAAGQEPPLPANGKAERELRAAQQPADVERLDAALRGLGHGLAGRDVPDIVGVRLVGGDVHVLLAEPDDDPPQPWLDEGTQWALPAYAQPPATDQPATPLPLLITIGSRAGRHLLIDLDRLGTLSIGGHPYRARDVLRHIACELACNTWSEKATIILVGFGDEADVFTDIGPDRVTTTASISEAAALVRAELARRAGPPAVGVPMVLLVASPDAAARAELTAVHRDLAAVGRCGVAVVTTVPDGTPVGSALLTVTDTGMLKADLPGLRLSTDAAVVPVDMLDPMAQVFRTARLTTLLATPAAPPTPTLPEWDDSIDPTAGVLNLFDPSTPEPGTVSAAIDATPAAAVVHNRDWDLAADRDQLDVDLAAWRDRDPDRPRVGILGPIDVYMPGKSTDSRHRLYTEMLLYLLTRANRSADRASIENALWYGNPAGDTTVRKSISMLRRWLGPRPECGDWIPEHDIDGAYRLRDGVLLDWHLLQRLRQRGETRGAAGVGDYRAALDLVRGVPMRNAPDAGPYRRPYTWIGDSDIAPGRLIAAITDLAHRVAEHHLGIGDTTTVRWAIDQAWLADPDRSFDDLWYDRMRADHLDGRKAALQRLLAEYLEARDAEVLEDLPTPTYNRIRELIPDAA